ncbi:putative metalloprotease CJM1_0395 family protein [Oceanicoccus sp. KOV_DT_Chl]|uniref:putative metalloprotease CJM1_0395 family protein n=1 Tax=Oceanicoccus sp. KOV_DT_Chl TaxID=1904639 RepID=UPI002101C1F9|nr:putative metalloprotease CJM1_0395 family protein [Oceanicoccus sp. KOV_DT_Chl]
MGGEVPISLPSGGDDPRATLAAAEQVRRAALAPANPSPQDRSIAAEASQISTQAQADLAELQAQERAQQAEQSSQSRNDEQLKEEQREQEQRDKAAREERLEELRALARRSTQLGEQLVTLDNVQRNQNVGSVLDQLA